MYLGEPLTEIWDALEVVSCPIRQLIVPPLVTGACVIGGFGADLGSVLFMTGLQRGVPTDILGRVTALSSLGSVALIPAGFAIAGALAPAIGIQPMLSFGAIVIVFATAPALRTRGVAHMSASVPSGSLVKPG